MENELIEIYEKWHKYAKGRNTESLINLYADNAVFESPLVPIIMNKEIGILNGKSEILEFLKEGTSCLLQSKKGPF